ncbi:uncharacterized protein JCM15063_005517 [Sporobolomyces koalae]|uniref:uncharacterized protein n=1 Tax=Sporobolomyces koalae TaxID=500713 RepID=UPI00316F0C5B
MLGPLVKAQLVAFLTKKLLDSKVFTGGVEALHGSVSRIQQGAYDTLLQATQEHDAKFQPPHHLEKETTRSTHRPRRDESLKDQNSALRAFIEKTENELHKERREGRHR